MSATIETVLKGIEKTLDGMKSRANNADAYLNRVVWPQYQNLQAERWESKNDSQGETWTELSSTYATYKKKKFADYPGGGTKMLIATKRLFDGVIGPGGENRKVVTSNTLTVGTTVPYAGFVDADRPFSKWSTKTVEDLTSGYISYVIRGKYK